MGKKLSEITLIQILALTASISFFLFVSLVMITNRKSSHKERLKRLHPLNFFYAFFRRKYIANELKRRILHSQIVAHQLRSSASPELHLRDPAFARGRGLHGYALPGSEFEGVYFSKAVSVSYAVLNDALEESLDSGELGAAARRRYEDALLLPSESVRDFVGKLHLAFEVPLELCEEYLAVYERAVYGEEEIYEDEFQRILKTLEDIREFLEY